MTDALYLLLASGLTFIAMCWLALSLPSHWKQVAEGKPHSKRLKIAGWLTLAASGMSCLLADHPSMAVLVWLMLIAGAAFCVGMLLSYRPLLLRLLVLPPFARH